MTGNSLVVLLIDDDARDARLTVRALQSANLPVHIDVVEDGEEALDFLFRRGAYRERSKGHPPILILLDLKLPKVNGLQVLQEIKSRAETKTIPVVALTSSRERSGYDGVLPIRSQQLYPKAGGFRAVPGDNQDPGALLDKAQRAAAGESISGAIRT